MALPSAQAERLDALKTAAAGQEWAALLPQPTDSEEQRQAKRRQLVKALHVKSGGLDGLRTQLHEAEQQQPGGDATVDTQRIASRERPAPPQPAEGGWKQVVRGNQAEQRSSAALPAWASPAAAAPVAAPAAAPEPAGAEAAPDADDAAAAEYHTPLLGRMLPAPGRAAAKAAQQGSGATAAGTTVPRSGLSSGVSSLPTSSSGIPTVPTTGAAAAVDVGSAAEEQIAARRRRRHAAAEPALGSGRLPLSAGGFLSGPVRGPASAPTLPGPTQQTQPAGEGQPRQRRWRQQQAATAANPLAHMMQRHAATAAHQQQHGSQPPLSQLLLDGGVFQSGRPSRFAPDPALPVAAPASLTTQIGPSQLLEGLCGGQLASSAAAQEQQQQQQQHGEQQQQKRQRQEGRTPAVAHPEEEQQARRLGQHPPGGTLPPERQQAHQQLGLRQQTPASAPRQCSRPAAAVTGTAGLGPLLGTGTVGTVGPLPSDWTLPPTPSCMHAFSPDSPATAAAPAGGAAAGQPASSAKPGAAAATAAAAAAAGGAATVPRRAGLSLTAETPMLFASPASALQQAGGGGEEQDGDEAGGRQLFVAETPSDPSAAAAASEGEGTEQQQLQQRRSQVAPVPLAPGALDAAAAPPPTAARPAASVCGLQLLLPQPVLQVSPCADGRHLALLLGNFAPAGEPSDVLVLQLPSELADVAGDAPAAEQGCGGSCCGVRVVACVAVQRSKWGEGLELTPNCLQLAATERAGLQLVLSAALELADEPPAAQPCILVLPLSSMSRDSSSALPDDKQRQRQLQQAVSPPGQILPPRPRRLRQGQQPLAIECRDVPLTCVLAAGSQELLVAGDGSGEVRRLSFDPLWRSYTWDRSLPPAKYRALDFEDLQQLQLYRDPEGGSTDAPPRRLLLGLSSSGRVALWDVDRSELLAARPCLDWRIRCLQPLSVAQAGLTTPVKQRVSAGAAAARPAGAAGGAVAAGSSTHLFVGLVEHRQSGRQQVAALMLSPTGLTVSASGALELPRPQPGRRPQPQHAQQQQVTALAAADGGCCWLGTAAGELLPWVLAGHGDTDGMAAAVPGGRVHGCSSRSAVTCAASLPSGEWQLVAATAGGCCTLLARR